MRKEPTFKSLLKEFGGLLSTLGTLMISVMEDKTKVLLEYALPNDNENEESEERARYFVNEFDNMNPYGDDDYATPNPYDVDIEEDMKSDISNHRVTTQQYPERFISDGIMDEVEE